MSQFISTAAQCRRGHTFSVTVATSINASARPATRRAILARRFHVSKCPSCATPTRVEARFCFIDPERTTAVVVRADQDSIVDLTIPSSPLLLELEELGADSRSWTALAVPDLATLRELLVLQDAGVDPRRLATVRARILAGEVASDSRPTAPPRVIAVTPETWTFGKWDRESGYVAASATTEEIANSSPVRLQWHSADHRERHPFAEHRHRDDNDLPARLLDEAVSRATRDVVVERLTDVELADFVSGIAAEVDAGATLTNELRERIGTAIEVADRNGWVDIASQGRRVLWDVTLDKKLEDAVTPEELQRLWDVVLELPWSETIRNRELKRITRADDPDFAGYAWTTDELLIGSDVLKSITTLRRKLVHEIGHSVHDRHRPAIDSWLEDTFGWKMHPATEAGVDAWISEMGPWPSGWSELDRSRWRRYIIDSVRPTELAPGALPLQLGPPAKRPPFDEVGPLRDELDQAEAAGLKIAPLLRNPLTNWFQSIAEWPEIDKRRFALNYYYGGLMSVPTATCELIANKAAEVDRPLGDYAAMSPMEFFAELYVAMRHKVAHDRRANDPAKGIRDYFFINVWGRRDDEVARIPPPTWRWAMDGIAALHG